MAYSKTIKDSVQKVTYEDFFSETDQELKNLLLTLDGLGIEAKRYAIQILLEREYAKGLKDGMEGFE